jgi:hypothetical protein
MDPSRQKIKSQLASMRLIYYAIAAPIVALSGVIYFLVSTGSLGPPDYSIASELQTAAMIIVPLTLGAGYFVFRSSLGKIDARLPLSEKLQKYFVLLIIRSAFFETGFLFCFVATFLTRELLFLSVAPLILFIFLLLIPNADSISSDLSLPPQEKSQLEFY